MELTDEQLDVVVGGSNEYSQILNIWRKYLKEGTYGDFYFPSGMASSPCPQGAQQIGFLETPDANGDPIPRCVRDGATINSTSSPLEEDFQEDVKKQHKKMKIRLLKTGGNKTKAAPFNQDPSMERSKSAPVGFGGS